MNLIGESIRSITGREYMVMRRIDIGGQGIAYECIRKGRDSRWVLKVYHQEFNTQNTRIRLYWLYQQRGNLISPMLVLPQDILDRPNILGHFTPFIINASALEIILTAPGQGISFMDKIIIADSIARAIGIQHEKGISHGDIQSKNILVRKKGKIVEIYIIDFDNFSYPGIPPPPCLGHKLYMSPRARQGNSPIIEDDCFSLTVLNHELLLGRSPSTGFDQTEQQFEQAMTAGVWLHDPTLSKCGINHTCGGYPSGILSTDVMRLFRNGFSLDSHMRPSAHQWWEVLSKDLLSGVYECSYCNRPSFIDSSKLICPHCNYSYPILTLSIPHKGIRIPLKESPLVLGREQMGWSPKISRTQVIIRRFGPVYQIEHLNAINPTYWWDGEKWLPLSKGQQILVDKGDRLVFADTRGILI